MYQYCLRFIFSFAFINLILAFSFHFPLEIQNWKEIPKFQRYFPKRNTIVYSIPIQTNANDFDIPTLKNVKFRINQIIEPSNIIAIKIRHIAVTSKEIAEECKILITSNQVSFESLAEKLSLCEETKHKGGESSWIPISSDITTTIPIELINKAIYMNKGDMLITQSYTINAITNTQEILWHVLQLLDVEMKLSTSTVKRKRENFQKLKNWSLGSKSDSQNNIMSYYMETMGCQMNVADSERMQAQLTNLGYIATNQSSNANIVILNTCSVRDHAEQKVYSYIGPHALRKRKGEDVSIIVAGCVAQQEGEVLAKRFPEVDIIMGPQYANRLGDLMESVITHGEQVIATEPIYQMEDSLKSQRSSDITAFVNVIYGCNEHCTFCVVPTTRGVEQSRTKEAIIQEIEELVKDGYQEVTLLGQNVDAWGR